MGMILTRRYNIDRFGYLIPHRYGNLPMMGAVATYRPGEGRFGDAVAVEEGTTNLLSESAFDRLAGIEVANINGWSRARRITRTSGTLFNTVNIPCDADTEYTMSVYARAVRVSPGSEFRIYMGDDGDSPNESLYIQPGSEWRRYVLTRRTSPNATRITRASIHLENLVVGDIIEIADWQLEAKPFATSFVDGTRASGRLSYPVNFNMDEGTIRCYFYLNKTAVINAPTSFPSIFLAGQGTGTRNWFWVYFNEPRTLLRFQRRTDSGSTSGGMVDLSHFDELSDGWHDVAIVWDHASGVIRAFLDGEFKGTATYDKNDLIPFDRIDVGYRQSLPGASNLLFDELLILPYAASEEEIRAWYEADGPIPPHPDALLQWDWQAVRPATMVAL